MIVGLSYVTIMPLKRNISVVLALISVASLPWTGRSGGHNVAEDATEAAEDCPLHGAGQLPTLASAATPRDTVVHLRADPPLPQRKPLHH